MLLNIFQRKLLSCCRDEPFYLKYAKHLSNTDFNIFSGFHFDLFKILEKLYLIGPKSISFDNFVIELKNLLDAQLINQPAADELLDLAHEVFFTEIETTFVEKKLLDYIRFQQLSAFSSKADISNVNEVLKSIQDISNVDLSENVDDYLSISRKKCGKKQLISTLIPTLDVVLGGGMDFGELGIVMGATGIGKSIFLLNMGFAAVLQKFNVLHVTCELSKGVITKRYDSLFSGLKYDDIDENVVDIVKSKLNGVSLKIKDTTSGSCTVQTIKNICNECKAKVVVVDYLDLLRPNKFLKEKRFELTNITIELKNIAKDCNVLVWTATQTNRKAFGRAEFGLDCIGEDKGKADNCDVLLGLGKEAGSKKDRVRIQVLKNRERKSEGSVELHADYGHMKLRSF